MEIAEKLVPNKINSIEAINTRTLRQRLREYKGRPMSLILKLLMLVSIILSAGVLVMLIGYILVNGIPALIKFFPSIFA